MNNIYPFKTSEIYDSFRLEAAKHFNLPLGQVTDEQRLFMKSLALIRLVGHPLLTPMKCSKI